MGVKPEASSASSAGCGRFNWNTTSFGLLTMIVSLEAIFLSTFVMISQNRQAARDTKRNQLDFETNIRSEIWSIHIGEALGLDVDHVEDIVAQAMRGARQAMESKDGPDGPAQAQAQAQSAPSQPTAPSPAPASPIPPPPRSQPHATP